MIQKFINALALTNEKNWFYFDTETKTIVKNRSTVDGMDVIYLARTYPERFLPLPNKKQIHTYAIMEEYVKASPRLDIRGREKLHTALQRTGPFKRFRDEAHRLGLEEDWLQYRDRRFEQMAREWCAQRHISLPVPGSGPSPKASAPSPKASGPSPKASSPSPKASSPSPTVIVESHGEESNLAIALIESIRVLFHMLDDANFEVALDELVAGLKQK